MKNIIFQTAFIIFSLLCFSPSFSMEEEDPELLGIADNELADLMDLMDIGQTHKEEMRHVQRTLILQTVPSKMFSGENTSHSMRPLFPLSPKNSLLALEDVSLPSAPAHLLERPDTLYPMSSDHQREDSMDFSFSFKRSSERPSLNFLSSPQEEKRSRLHFPAAPHACDAEDMEPSSSHFPSPKSQTPPRSPLSSLNPPPSHLLSSPTRGARRNLSSFLEESQEGLPVAPFSPEKIIEIRQKRSFFNQDTNEESSSHRDKRTRANSSGSSGKYSSHNTRRLRTQIRTQKSYSEE